MIALARSYPEGPVSLAEIARVEDISMSYLEHLMAALRKSGLVEGTRGVHGGYRLSSAPGAMMVGEVFRALEGPIAPAVCASEGKNVVYCEREGDCPSRTFWRQVRDNIVQVMDTTTLADLAGGGGSAVTRD
jgi:Rrf2 family cysteine metabolism transcriptional repressor